MAKDKPIIQIGDPIHEILERINKTIWAIIAVLVMGFITLLIVVIGLVLDTWRVKTNSYEALVERIRCEEKRFDSYKTEHQEINTALKAIEKDIHNIRRDQARMVNATPKKQ